MYYFCTQALPGWDWGKPLKEKTSCCQTASTAEQEAEAKVLEAKIQKAIQTEIADLARLMVSKSDRELSAGPSFKFAISCCVWEAKVYEEHLREKKRLPGSG